MKYLYLYFYNLREEPPKTFELHLKRMLPKSITRCQGNCGKKIEEKDVMLIKSYGTTRWTDKKSGKEMTKYGPMYIHFNEKCMKRFNDDKFYGPGEQFDYSLITLSKETVAQLNDEEAVFLKDLGINF